MRICWSGRVVLLIGILGFFQFALTAEHSDSLDVEINSDGVGTVRATLQLPARRELVRSVLMDYQHWPKLFPRTPTIHYIKRLEGRVRVGMTVPAFFLPLTLRLVTETHESQPFRIVTRLVEGDFERYDWVWDLTIPGDDAHTDATLILNVKPQFWTPDWALIWILETDLKEHFELLRKELIRKGPRRSKEPQNDDSP